MEASKKGDTATVKALLDGGADANLITDDGRTALMVAASRGNTTTVQTLLAKGADVEARDDSGNTVFMNAVVSGYSDTVNVLLDEGVDVNAESECGWSPLVFASAFGYPHIVQVVLDEGADVGEYGGLALDWVAYWGGSNLDRAKIKFILKKAGAKQRDPFIGTEEIAKRSIYKKPHFFNF